MKLGDVMGILNAITGWNWDADDLIEAGNRAFTLERLINIRDGFDRKFDTLPKKMTIPAKEGGRIGRVPLPFDSTLEKYYDMRGWDKQGHPTRETLKKIDLSEYVDYIV
jgi:aldehyde:ferredoxin oxidoreductase